MAFENLSLLSIFYFKFCKSEKLMFDMLMFFVLSILMQKTVTLKTG